MLPAILGGLATGAGSSLVGSLFGGGSGAPTYQPSETMQDLAEYGRGQLKASRAKKRAIIDEAKSYTSPGAREAFLQSYVDRFSNPEFIEKRLSRSYKRPIDYNADDYRNVASFAYGLQGLDMPEKSFEQYMNIAKSSNIRSPEAFSDFVRQSMIASDLVKTPQDQTWEYSWGEMARGPDGRLRRGMFRFNPANVSKVASAMLGT